MPQASWSKYEDLAAAGDNNAPFPADALTAPAWRTPKGVGAFLTITGAGETVGDIELTVKAGTHTVCDKSQPNVRGAGVPVNSVDDVLVKRMFVPGRTPISVRVHNNDGANAAEYRLNLTWES